jgi:hypothetical protein
MRAVLHAEVELAVDVGHLRLEAREACERANLGEPMHQHHLRSTFDIGEPLPEALCS